MRITLTTVLLFGYLSVFGQVDSLLQRPYRDKLNAIHYFYLELIDSHIDSASGYKLIGQLRQAAKRVGDREGLMEADLAEALFDRRVLSKSLDKMHRMVQRGKDADVWHIGCRAAYVIAQHHWDLQAYEQAFRWYGTVDSMLQQVSMTDFPNKVEYLKDIGIAHYKFGDYARAIRYFQESTQRDIHPFFENAWKHAVNTMGLAYQKLSNLDRSDSCFRQILVHNHKDTEVWEGIAAGNLGYNQYLRGDEEAAIPLLQKDIDIAVKYRDYGLASGSSIPMADMLVRRGELARAKSYLDSAYVYIHRSGQTERLHLLFPVMVKWYAASGQPLMAARFMDSTMEATARFHNRFSALRMLRATQERMASQREADLQRLRVEGQKQINQRNLTLGGLILCLLFGGFWWYKQRKANELALKDRDLRLLEANSELNEARIQLHDFARAVAEKNQLLEAQANAERTNENHELIEQLAKQVVLTNDDWNRFSALFGKVYPGFQHQLKSRYPTLTPAEIRCLSMEKLRFSNKEMAALQGISTSTVMATKHRIRKKLGVASHAEVVALVQSI